eukprot:Skav212850  [mRNA]  locus=scaffold325:246445:248690:- [translate_table: standard]
MAAAGGSKSGLLSAKRASHTCKYLCGAKEPSVKDCLGQTHLWVAGYLHCCTQLQAELGLAAARQTKHLKKGSATQGIAEELI